MESKKENNTREKVHLKQIFLTVCLYVAFITIGLASSLTGPCLVHLSYLYNTNIAGMSVTFTCNAIGYLLGSILCAVILDRFNQELQFFLACIEIGLLTAAAPWLPNIYGYFAVMLVQNIGKGFIDAAGQSYIIRIWSDHRWKDPVMQGVHGVWSFGAFVGPLIVGPFLVDLPKEGDPIYPNCTSPETASIIHDTSHLNLGNDDILIGVEKVRYPFAIVGGTAFVLSLAYLAGFIVTRNSPAKHNNTKNNKGKRKLPGETLSFKIPIIIMQFIFFLFYAWYEAIPGALISAFVIKGIEWPVQSGPRLTSVYWVSHGFGRVLGIPISLVLSPTAMLVINILLTTAAFILMFFATSLSDILIWISVALAAFGMSTTFASAILWTSNHITITGAVGAMFLMASSVGSMSGVTLAGYLFDNASHMWVVYLSLLSSCIHVVLFAVMYIFARIHNGKVKKSDKMTVSEDIVCEVKPLNMKDI